MGFHKALWGRAVPFGHDDRREGLDELLCLPQVRFGYRNGVARLSDAVLVESSVEGEGGVRSERG